MMMDVGDCIMLRNMIVDVKCDLWCAWLIMMSGDGTMLSRIYDTIMLHISCEMDEQKEEFYMN